ncbi:MAG: helix-turn-helix transcriptional regulator [Paraburkholderia sp.]|jgi:transcriptional regulator with XRE-family HTH domain|uniref:helix-turn-helix domain-containing protein n=1 Tax=unclassified Paraburkholderia TaxID=2615204 RepID=UPI0028624824|nr:helix-turn-helix transcriptional regulator [Paraburkholderia sp. USG1]MDR8394747.1 helix-turn-helix domain-containing protein [Paraburkholderia sp. USG1]
MSSFQVEEAMAAIGRAIAKHRVRCGISQLELGRQLGVKDEAMSRLERGVVTLTVDRLVQLADIFGCNVADLLTQGSHRTTDQARYVSQLLGKLGTDDRTMVVEFVERLAARLAHR